MSRGSIPAFIDYFATWCGEKVCVKLRRELMIQVFLLFKQLSDIHCFLESWKLGSFSWNFGN
jgi:hypothetical protein